MPSFKSRLSNNGKNLLDTRANNLAEMTRIEASGVLSNYQAKVLRLQNQIENHADLAVESTHSLRPGSKDFDPKAWVDTEVQLQKDLRMAKIEYKLVKSWFDEMFPTDEVISLNSVDEEE